MTDFPDSIAPLPAIADLCRRGIARRPVIDELDGALFAPEQPAIVRGDPETGVVATVDGDDGAYVRLLVVDPAPAGAVTATCSSVPPRPTPRRGAHVAHVGADAPFFLWAGVPTPRPRCCACSNATTTSGSRPTST